MRIVAIVIAALGAASFAAAQGVEAPKDVVSQPPLVLEVTVRQYAAENRMAASAGNSGTGQFEGYVWATSSLCGLSANNSEPATVPGVGWHFTAEVLSSSAGQMSISVRWQRMWDKGAKSEVPKGTQQVTLREGERIELDRVLPAGPGPCAAVDARLEATVVARPAYRLTMVNGRLGAFGGRGGRGAGVSGGVGAGVAGATAGMGGSRGGVQAGATTGVGGGRGGVQAGTTTGVGGSRGGVQAGATTGMSGGRGGVQAGATGVGGGRGGGTGGRGAAAGSGAGIGATGAGVGGGGVTSSSTTTGAQGGRGTAGTRDSVRTQDVLRLMAPAMYNAELWLVHREPNGTETVQQQAVRFGGSLATYAFPPIQVSTARGTITLDITGKLQAFVGDPPDPDKSDRRLVAFRGAISSSDPQLAQRIMLSISRRARAAGTPLLDITGGSSMAIDLPSPTDVLSFEFPALQKATEDLLKGHQFSLRMRLTPVGGR